MSQSTAQHSARTREDILAELAGQASALRRLGVTSLGVFGSYARNEQTATSDVDLLVTFDRLTFRAYMDAKLLLEAALGLPVDLALADDLRPRLRERVLNEVTYVAGLSAYEERHEAQIERNQAVIALLDAWEQDDSDEQRETLDLLMRTLGEHRPSSRKLFAQS